MQSQKITSLNTYSEAVNAKYVKAKDYNKVIEDLERLYPVTNQSFTGEVYMDRAYTHYEDYTVSTDIVLSASLRKFIGSAAEVRFIGDGSHSPVFTALTASSTTEAYDNSLGAINKVVFYYDGTEVFYSITVL